MPPIIVEFPSILKFTDRTDPQLMFNNRSGGIALDGSEQIVSPLSERWKYRVNVPIRNPEEVQEFRVVLSKLKGRYNYLRMRLCDQNRIRKDPAYVPPSGDLSVPFSDDAPFSDDVGFYYLNNWVWPKVDVTSSANEGTSVVYINADTFGGIMKRGVFFSINDWLYLIEDWSLVGPNYVLNISPPLREDISIGDAADFSATAIWILSADEVGNLDLQIGRLGVVTLDLIEPVLRDL